MKKKLHQLKLHIYQLIAGAVLVFSCSAALAAGAGLFENLEPVEGAKAALVEIDLNADFGAYKRVAILDAQVAFRSGWARDHKRPGSRIGISRKEMDQIKSEVAELFTEVFSEVLTADGGYEIVDVSGEDVLLLRPSIIDLDVTAPDIKSAHSTRTYTNETGAATLYIELFDSVSGQIIGRAADRQAIRRGDERYTWSNKASNRADAEKMFRSWAQTLREFLDSYYSD